jgi:hypothetical protein
MSYERLSYSEEILYENVEGTFYIAVKGSVFSRFSIYAGVTRTYKHIFYFQLEEGVL